MASGRSPELRPPRRAPSGVPTSGVSVGAVQPAQLGADTARDDHGHESHDARVGPDPGRFRRVDGLDLFDRKVQFTCERIDRGTVRRLGAPALRSLVFD